MNFAPNEILLFIWYSSLKIFCTAVKKKSIIKLAIPKSSECYFFFFVYHAVVYLKGFILLFFQL